MTRKELLKSLFPELSINFTGCTYVVCGSESCDECKYHDYWNKPAVIPVTVAKRLLNTVYGTTEYFDTDSLKIVTDAYNTGKTHAQKLQLIQDGWTKFPSLHNNIEWSMLKDIIDDALDNGFEVTILNGTIYYREKQ